MQRKMDSKFHQDHAARSSQGVNPIDREFRFAPQLPSRGAAS
jgi:hypothetical protein